MPLPWSSLWCFVGDADTLVLGVVKTSRFLFEKRLLTRDQHKSGKF